MTIVMIRCRPKRRLSSLPKTLDGRPSRLMTAAIAVALHPMLPVGPVAAANTR